MNHRSLRVLIVEDSAVLAARLTELMQEPGADVGVIETADTEADALALIETCPPDVVILDLHLRIGSGFGVLRGLASCGHRPKVVILSNTPLPEYRLAADGFGVEAFLDKSRDWARLRGLLREFAKNAAIETTP